MKERVMEDFVPLWDVVGSHLSIFLKWMWNFCCCGNN